MGKRRPKSYRVNLTWEAMQGIAQQLIAGDGLMEAAIGTGELCRSSSLHRTKTTGRYTAHLVYRQGDQSTAITIRNIEVAP
ncbi:hypothetical protein [Pleomorphomonas koreensis]|uniref:hypothetical protein n=1 Tax=Pleomorphomonas koreensis TaxID=257440 RepID=UPI00040857F3|nr:hypothetical protein [Pleomorphomonas koreensis]